MLREGMGMLASARLRAVQDAAAPLAARAQKAFDPQLPASGAGPIARRAAAAQARVSLALAAERTISVIDAGVSEQAALIAPLACALDWLAQSEPSEAAGHVSLAERIAVFCTNTEDIRRGELMGAMGSTQIELALLSGNVPPEPPAQAIDAMVYCRLAALAYEVERWLEAR